MDMINPLIIFVGLQDMVMSAMYCVLHTTYPPVHFLTLAHMSLHEPEKYEMIKELVKARVEDKDATPYLETMNCLMDDFKNLCETLKERVKG